MSRLTKTSLLTPLILISPPPPSYEFLNPSPLAHTLIYNTSLTNSTQSAHPTTQSPVAQINHNHDQQPSPNTHSPPSIPTSQHPQPITTSHNPTPTIPSTVAHSPTFTGPTTLTQTHLMVTHVKVGTVKPNPSYNLHTSHISPLPKSPSIYLYDPNWHVAMYDEYNALVKNSTWILVPKPPNANVVWSMRLFRHKYHADGSLSRYKARLVANGRTQQVGIDCDDTFSLVVKPASIRTVLSLALSRKWLVHQLDVKNAFLNGDISETVYIYQPSGFVDSHFLHHVCQLQRSLYGLKQAPLANLLIYVDDIVLTASSTDLLQRITSSLHKEFDMTDLGALNYFLGISVTRDSTCMFPSQKKYAFELLDRAHMANYNPTRMPVDTESKLSSDGDPISDPTLYRSLAGSLVAYTDADWAGCPTTRQSTSAEYRGVANVVAETVWLRNLLRELHIPLFSTTLVYCDNVSAIYMTANHVQHQRTKHIEIDIHFVHDMVARGQVRVLHVPSRYQYADIFTKGLPYVLFEEFCTSLSVRSPPA
ncbi:ribonuclease H-like domain-containing protein [Tanacetum coccineum]